MPHYKYLAMIALFVGTCYCTTVFGAITPAVLKITPAIIDLKMKKRDFEKVQIVIQNLNSQPVDFYPFVYDIDAEGQWVLLEGGAVDHASSLGHWLEFSRNTLQFRKGMLLRHEFNLLVNVNPFALPGIYHAVIAFAAGADREQAKDNLKNASIILVNVEIVADVIERMNLKKFISDRVFVSGSTVGFAYELENNGNRDLVPAGEIRIYDRRGVEITALPINLAKENIKPRDTLALASVWNTVGGIGRYKALLDISYGVKGEASVQDIIFIWIMPWKYIMLTVGIFIIFAGGLITMLYRRNAEA